MKSITTIAIASCVGAVLGAGAVQVAQQFRPVEGPPPERQAAPIRAVPVVRTVTNTVKQGAENTVTQTVTRTVVVPDEQLVATLQVRIRDLTRSLDVTEAELAQFKAEREAAQRSREERRQSWRDREATMKEEDPEGYAEIQERREAFREQMTQAVSDKQEFLHKLDTSAMTEDEKVAHDELLMRIEAAWGAIEKIQQGGFPDREARQKLREDYHVLAELYEGERDYVLRQVGVGLGYTETEAVGFGTYMKEIFELTSPRPSGGMGTGRRGPGGSRGGAESGGAER